MSGVLANNFITLTNDMVDILVLQSLDGFFH